MSHPTNCLNQDMPFIQSVEVSVNSLEINISEGDWDSYQNHIAKIQKHDTADFDRYGGLLAYKRACALAYLGKHALIKDRASKRTQSRILTTELYIAIKAVNQDHRPK